MGPLEEAMGGERSAWFKSQQHVFRGKVGGLHVNETLGDELLNDFVEARAAHIERAHEAAPEHAVELRSEQQREDLLFYQRRGAGVWFFGDLVIDADLAESHTNALQDRRIRQRGVGDTVAGRER